MFLLKQILPAVVLALLVAAAVSGLGLFLRKGYLRQASTSLALALGYFSGHFLITGWVRFPPADTTNWLPYFALAAVGFGALHSFFLKPSTVVRTLLLTFFCGAALRLLLGPKFRYEWSLSEGWMWVAFFAFAIVCLTLVFDALGRRSPTGIELLLVLLIVGAGTFGALMLSGSMLLAQFAAVLAAAAFGALVFTPGRLALVGDIALPFSLLLSTLLLSGYFFAELPTASAVLLAIAPALALLPIAMPARLRTSVVRVALLSLSVAAAVFLAFRSSPPFDY